VATPPARGTIRALIPYPTALFLGVAMRSGPLNLLAPGDQDLADH